MLQHLCWLDNLLFQDMLLIFLNRYCQCNLWWITLRLGVGGGGQELKLSWTTMKGQYWSLRIISIRLDYFLISVSLRVIALFLNCSCFLLRWERSRSTVLESFHCCRLLLELLRLIKKAMSHVAFLALLWIKTGCFLLGLLLTMDRVRHLLLIHFKLIHSCSVLGVRSFVIVFRRNMARGFSLNTWLLIGKTDDSIAGFVGLIAFGCLRFPPGLFRLHGQFYRL